MRKFPISHTILSSSLFLTCTCVVFSLMIYVFITFYGFQIHPCIGLPKYYEIIVSITMFKVQVWKLKICLRAESWWQREKRMAYGSGSLHAQNYHKAALLGFFLFLSEALAKWYIMMSTSRQNKTAYGELRLIISHLGKMQRTTRVSLYVTNSRSVLNVMSVSSVNEFQRVYVIIELEMTYSYLMYSGFSHVVDRKRQNIKDREQTYFVRQWQASYELQYPVIETISSLWLFIHL